MPTPLEALIRRMIALDGPMRIDRYMALCLGHPEFGYYRYRDPLGAAGDFTTAPEISQMFGELAGLWLVDAWRRIGAPGKVKLIELGPGRGTLMADILRVTRRFDDFAEAIEVHLVETSLALQARQRATLEGNAVSWHADLASVPEGPALIIANEFLDCMPVRQFVMTENGWRERVVALDTEGALCFGLDSRMGEDLGRAPVGTLREVSPMQERLMADELGPRLNAHSGLALFFDYGPAGHREGDSLQALKRHMMVSPLATPGECDLTAHVQFGVFASAAQRAGLAVHGPARQGDFLLALGLAARAGHLARSANEQAGIEAVQSQFDRLTAMSESGMGSLFKVMALSSPQFMEFAALPPFESPTA